MAERKHIQKERCREVKGSKRAQKKKSLSLQVEGGAIEAKAVQKIERTRLVVTRVLTQRLC